ncbi:protein bride of sevenless isoform X2 [Cephus cinctus]|uniref:Protein bride of sevenless isoform X2 n=1 Tax=Cephus cinctus TaxID=211228 RepID=A0AAJ7BH89_CEPCN|nr:protein bride of sevenless isoform X2 [Cephus cinctus]
MFRKIILILYLLRQVVTIEEVMCSGNRTLLETPGDAVISVFVDVNYGPYCNISSPKAYQEVATALYVVQTLNKYDYVPGILLGVKIFDTCHDKMVVYKQALLTAVDLECVSHYEMGILVAEKYHGVIEPLQKYSVLPVSNYKDENLTKPLLNVMVNFLSTKFEVVDLFVTSSQYILGHFLEASKDAGICVKSYREIIEADNETEITIVLIGTKEEINSWINNFEIEIPEATWIILSLDDSNIDDIAPVGSYVIKSESLTFDPLQDPFDDNFLPRVGPSIIHSPYILSIGKSIIELAQVLQDIQKRTCPDGGACTLPHFNSSLRKEISNAEVYEALHILPKSHSIRYVIVRYDASGKSMEVRSYKIDASKYRIKAETGETKMSKLCVGKYLKNCRKCANFQRRADARSLVKNIRNHGFLKAAGWIPICMTIVVCGTFSCVVIIIFIIYRFFVDEVLDGNPALTIVLILATIFMLQAVFPFCMEDEVMGSEQLNARKIYVSTLSIGLAFSTMLSRALFLAFSTGGLLTKHINGYLQGLMVFFMFGVEVAISTMFFILNKEDSAVIARSLIFVALLGYDIFLLVTLFVVCCFITQIRRNYREGKCFFGTVIGLLIIWAVWVTCFVLMEPETRDTVVTFGVIATAYLIIIGILIPRTYYMVIHLSRDKHFAQRFEPADLGPDPRMNTVARQTRLPFYDYVHPTEGMMNVGNLNPMRYPNYYGNSSPNPRYLTRCRSPDTRRTPGHNNYGFSSEMREVENSYVVPRVCIENPEVVPLGIGTTKSYRKEQSRRGICTS